MRAIFYDLSAIALTKVAISDRSADARAVLPVRSFLSHVYLQALVCSVTTAILVGAGKPLQAAVALWSMLGFMLLRLALLRRHEELAGLLLGISPLLNLLRGVLFYSALAPLLAAALLFYAWHAPARVREAARRCPAIVTLCAAALVYYLFSALVTWQYTTNMRMLELAFTAALLLLIGHRRALLGAALLGVLLSGWAIGLGTYPHLDTVDAGRLGVIQIDGYALGNPFSLGMPLALGILAVLLDRGRWLNMEDRPVARLLLLVPSVILLALSTSRAAWLVVVVGTSVVFLRDGLQRARLLLAAGLTIGCGIALYQTPLGEPFRRGWDRTFSADRTLVRSTTGRSDQWIVCRHAVTDSFHSLVRGYGPGSGPRVYAAFSERLEDVGFAVGGEMVFHALFMHVAIEAGLAGLLPVLFWIVAVLCKIARDARRSGRMLPTACFLGYLLGATTVSGFDVVSGVLMGAGLLACSRVSGRIPGRPEHGKAGFR